MPADFKTGASLAGKILASGQITAAGEVTVYTVPASSAVKIATAVLCNVTNNVVTVYVSVVPSGSAVDSTRRIIHAYQLLAADSTTIAELAGSMLDAGAFISVMTSLANSVNYLITGVVSA